ncbi:MAG TPA: GNAT family N-acetyltransferase [Streptosporangiaceae bacterium]
MAQAPVPAAVDLAGVRGALAARWRSLDPLLPAPSQLTPGCDVGYLVAGADPAHPAAVGSCEHWTGEPGTMDFSWGAARRFTLTAHVAGPDVPGALDDLLAAWRDHLVRQPHAGDPDTAAVVLWPSRDIDGVAVLRRRGFTPMCVVAARTKPRQIADRLSPVRSSPPPQPASASQQADQDPQQPDPLLADPLLADPRVRIRRAGPADLDTVTRLGLEVIRFDSRLGCVTMRDDSADALRRSLAGPLAGPRPWTWLAERDGVAVGMLHAEPPAGTGWIAPLSGRAPVAYLTLGFVAPDERRSGVGAALTARLHAEADAAGVAVTLLHYEQANPLSVPFWSQQGYRPAWTSWEAWPASALR